MAKRLFNAFLPSWLERKEAAHHEQNQVQELQDFLFFTLAGIPGAILGAVLVEMPQLGQRRSMALCVCNDLSQPTVNLVGTIQVDGCYCDRRFRFHSGRWTSSCHRKHSGREFGSDSSVGRFSSGPFASLAYLRIRYAVICEQNTARGTSREANKSTQIPTRPAFSLLPSEGQLQALLPHFHGSLAFWRL